MDTTKKGAFILAVVLFTIGFFANAFLTQVCIGECDGKYKGIRPTKEELNKTLADHEKWYQTYKPSNTDEAEKVPQEGRANLCEVALNGADLRMANLQFANLSGADLSVADLSGANLRYANLREAGLSDVNLSNAVLLGADLNNAVLTNANLSGTDLWKAILSGANLWNADLSKANLREADMYFVWFENKLGNLPKIESIAWARNLSQMQYWSSQDSLVELRDAFKKAGLRQQEREITYAIEHTRRQLRWKEGIRGKVESTFKLILFELTSKYGMSPFRPLLIILGLIFVFSIPYWFALNTDGRARVWQEWQKDMAPKDGGQEGSVPLYDNRCTHRRIWFAIYFSLLSSACYIGWRGLNIGEWIIRMQRYEYTMRAIGWVRTVSGIQAVISIYLVSLSILPYYGRPFE